VQVGPGGVPKEIYRSKPQGLSQLDSMQLSRAMAAKQAAQLALADPLKGAVSPEKYQAIIDEADSIINRVNPQAATPYTPKPSPAAPTPKEIIRVTKDGRRVVYDAVTKQPLRYGN
jgi:hypothetical protein